MDLSTIIGLVAGLAALAMGIFIGGGTLLMFVDAPSVMITVGGSFCAMLVAHNIPKMVKMFGVMRFTIFPPKYNLSELIITLVSFSEKARREGLLALEDDLDELDDQFMKKGLQLVVDGTDPELVRSIMESELEQTLNRHDASRKLFDDWAALAPSFGMIGTLQGLIMMLANLEDRAALGPTLSIALMTTLYGAIMAYLLFSPMSYNLESQTNHEALNKMIVIEGVLFNSVRRESPNCKR